MNFKLNFFWFFFILTLLFGCEDNSSNKKDSSLNLVCKGRYTDLLGDYVKVETLIKIKGDNYESEDLTGKNNPMPFGGVVEVLENEIFLYHPHKTDNYKSVIDRRSGRFTPQPDLAGLVRYPEIICEKFKSKL